MCLVAKKSKHKTTIIRNLIDFKMALIKKRKKYILKSKKRKKKKFFLIK